VNRRRPGSPTAMNPSRPRPRARGGVAATKHATLAFDLLCQASLVCGSGAPMGLRRSSAHADRIEAAEREIRCAAYLVSARLPPTGRRRAERSVRERLVESVVPPPGSVDDVLALLEHAQDTIEHLLRTCDASEEEYLAGLHVGLARHELECTSS
jgi:hypothetical protein